MSKNGHQNSTTQSKHSKHHHHHHQSKRSPPALTIDDNTDQYSNSNGYHHTSISTPSSVLSPIQCAAYFIHRVDLDDYTAYTLKQTVDNVVSGPKSKGLKVRLSLPDDGLIIENIPDPNQSWMYKTSELLYFWRDTYYLNVIVVITINRSHYHSIGSYSASIFRLRGNESVQAFLQRAQQYFAQLSTNPISRNNSKVSMKQLITVENSPTKDNRKDHKKKTKHHSLTSKRADKQSHRSLQSTPVPPPKRTEFEPVKTTLNNSTLNLYSRRTYSETTVLSDTPTTNSIRLENNDYEVNKSTTSNGHFSEDLVIELMRELKELRHEIAELKSESRFTPVRAASASPLSVLTDYTRENSNSSTRPISHAEIDAGTQTDLNYVNQKREELSTEDKTNSDTSYHIPLIHETQNNQTDENINKHSGSNGTEPYRTETKLVNFSSINGSSNGHALHTKERHQSRSLIVKPRPILKKPENGITSLNNSNLAEKETQQTSSPKNSSSIAPDRKTALTKQNEGVISFRSSLEDTIPIPEHFYENVPIFIQVTSNQGSLYAVPLANGRDQQEGKSQIYANLKGDRGSEFQPQQYLPQMIGSQNRISLLIPQQLIPNNRPSLPNENGASNIQRTPNNNPYPQQIIFANHLTNPLFTIDKQLLSNTIANQFGLDPHSPYLPQLVANQHWFVADKRTFANMVWPITPEEENALCSSPLTSTSTDADKDAIDLNNIAAKSILKSKKFSRSMSKKQRISWDSALK